MTDVFIILILLHFIQNPARGEIRTNFKISRFELCRNNAPLLIQGNISTEADKQYLTCTFVVPTILDENIGFTWEIESVIGNGVSVPVFTIKERNFCTAMNKYLGEFWYKILRAAQLTPGLCPIQAGRYHVQHVYLNYQQISLQTFPFGTLRFVWKLFNNRKPKDVLCCILMEVYNNSQS